MSEPLPLTRLEPLPDEPDADNLPPPAVNGSKPLMRLTKSQRTALCKEAGMVELDLNKLQKVAKIGEFAAQLGLYHIASAKLMALQSDVELLYAESVQVAKDMDDPALKVECHKILEMLAKHRIAALELNFKAAKDLPLVQRDAAGGQSTIPFPANTVVHSTNTVINTGASVK